MSFNLRVASDLESSAANIDLSDPELDDNNDNDSTYNFKEFSIQPSTGLIPAQSQVKLLVEFVPHFIKKYDTSLLVDIDDVGVELFSLPITARSTVPTISLITPTVDIGRCFIYHSYESVIKLANETQLKARYQLLPSRDEDTIKFVSNQTEVD